MARKPKRKGRSATNGATPKPTKKIDLLIDTIFSVLPATTIEEILAKVRRRWKRDEELSSLDISNAISHLRRNCVKYGWTISYVSPGRPTDVDTGRYFILEVNPDGSRKRCSARNQEHLRRGTKRVLLTTSRFNNNQAIALDVARPTLPLALQRDAVKIARSMLALSQDETKLLSALSKLEAA